MTATITHDVATRLLATLLECCSRWHPPNLPGALEVLEQLPLRLLTRNLLWRFEAFGVPRSHLSSQGYSHSVKLLALASIVSRV